MDPVSAIGVASTAYQAIVRGFKIGKEVQSMSQDIGKLMNAINDVKSGHEKAKKRKFGSIEEEALETFAAKKRAEQIESELRQFLIYNYGINAWNDVLRIQGQIRKERLEAMEAKKRRMNKILEITAAVVLMLVIGIGLTALVWWFYYLKNRNGS